MIATTQDIGRRLSWLRAGFHLGFSIVGNMLKNQWPSAQLETA